MVGSVSEAVSDVQEAVAEQIQEARADALEDAAAQIAVAEDTARAAHDALLMTELGRRVSAVETEIAQCRTENSSLRMEVQTLAALAQPAAPAVIVDNSSSTQQRPSGTEGALPPAEIPADQPSSEDAGGPEKTAPKPKRRLL